MGFVRRWLSDDTPCEALGDSVWVYLLSRNPFALLIGFGTVVLQMGILRAFSTQTETNYFSIGCNTDGEAVCQAWELSGRALGMVFCILFAWTLGDVMNGLHFICSTCIVQHRPVRMLWTGCVSFTIGHCTLWYAFFNILASATSDLEALLNVVGILYVMDIDEAVFSSMSKFAPHWHAKIVNHIQDEFNVSLSGKKTVDIAAAEDDKTAVDGGSSTYGSIADEHKSSDPAEATLITSIKC